jgi:hypothetical protein
LFQNVTIKHANIRGKRQNLSVQNTVTDEIVSVFSVPLEEAPLLPLSPLPTLPPRPHRRRKPMFSAMFASNMLFMPFLYPLMLTIFGVFTNQPLPLDIFMILVLFGSFLSNIGSLLLYIAARAANYLRTTVGIVALTLLVLQVSCLFLFRNNLEGFDPNHLRGMHDLIIMAGFTLIFSCMLALCIFSVLLLLRVFRKKSRKHMLNKSVDITAN